MTDWTPSPELVERWAKHQLEVSVGDGYAGFRIICHHDPADMTRPCWPHDTERDDPVPLPAPQGCNLTEWVDGLDPEDWFHGTIDFFCGLTVEWTGDGPPEVHPHPELVPWAQVQELVEAAQSATRSMYASSTQYERLRAALDPFTQDRRSGSPGAVESVAQAPDRCPTRGSDDPVTGGCVWERW